MTSTTTDLLARNPLEVYEVVITGKRNVDGEDDRFDEWVYIGYYGDKKYQGLTGEERALRTVKRLQIEHPDWPARVRYVRYLDVSQATLDALSG